ncbi:MAG: flagellar hook basal-body protein [Candidatus Eremiobacteraeota bacterium]|nr:flagellar hook basal-body protein [Candidatus Eremiobacteraeota bacterium]
MDGIELMSTAMHAAQARLDVSTSNLANVSSAGFHKRVARATLTANGLVTTSRVDASQGPLTHTGRAFDLAVVGAGGFFVRAPGGVSVEVRSASFERNTRGQLIDAAGRTLLARNGALVTSPDATIDARGIVRDAGREIARVRMGRRDAAERILGKCERRCDSRDGRRARRAACFRNGAEDARCDRRCAAKRR